MRRWIRYISLVLVAYLIAMVALFPARLAHEIVQPYLAKVPLSPRLYGVQGSIWSGRSSLLSLKQTPIGALHWFYRPWWLPFGRVAVHWHLDAEKGGLEGTVHLSRTALILNEINGQIPLETVLPLLPRCPTTMWGYLDVSLPTVLVEQGVLQRVIGTVIWKDAKLSLPQPVSLGDLTVTFEASNSPGIIGRFSDAGGPLQINGDLYLEPDGRYRVNALLKPRPSAAPELATTIAVLGRPDPQGRYRFTDSGKL